MLEGTRLCLRPGPSGLSAPWIRRTSSARNVLAAQWSWKAISSPGLTDHVSEYPVMCMRSFPREEPHGGECQQEAGDGDDGAQRIDQRHLRAVRGRCRPQI